MRGFRQQNEHPSCSSPHGRWPPQLTWFICSERGAGTWCTYMAGPAPGVSMGTASPSLGTMESACVSHVYASMHGSAALGTSGGRGIREALASCGLGW